MALSISGTRCIAARAWRGHSQSVLTVSNVGAFVAGFLACHPFIHDGSVCFRLARCDLLVSGGHIAITFIILTLTPVLFSSKSDASTRTLGHPIAYVDSSGITYLTSRVYNRSVILCIRKNIALVVIYFPLLNKNLLLKILWRLARSIKTEILMWRLARH
jgi:hypothetical protein